MRAAGAACDASATPAGCAQKQPQRAEPSQGGKRRKGGRASAVAREGGGPERVAASAGAHSDAPCAAHGGAHGGKPVAPQLVAPQLVGRSAGTASGRPSDCRKVALPKEARGVAAAAPPVTSPATPRATPAALPAALPAAHPAEFHAKCTPHPVASAATASAAAAAAVYLPSEHAAVRRLREAMPDAKVRG